MSYNGGRVVELNNQHNGLRGNINLDNNGHFVGIAKLLNSPGPIPKSRNFSRIIEAIS